MSRDRIGSFFYGTLMSPLVIARVLKRKIEDLDIQEAILHGYARHHITGRDYPAVISAAASKRLLPEQVEEPSVRGNIVYDLSEGDLTLLDCWEDEEYRRETLPIQIAGKKEIVDGFVYVWQEEYINALSPEIWDFEAFIRDKLAYWIDEATGTNEEEYAEVDALREELSQDMRGPSSRVTP